jgi:hypothetical protein
VREALGSELKGWKRKRGKRKGSANIYGGDDSA